MTVNAYNGVTVELCTGTYQEQTAVNAATFKNNTPVKRKATESHILWSVH